ncbi:MAG: N-acetylmuramic acid 6-phosphate etherase [Bacilli bacterium]|jgi:N-acetylmuramic acid 6-phosphate etherase|nr:N-acetylmuramic acid 6-phosphate etherase [Bacilli bacterium]MDD5182815.1 N-acetylmuramic acid 6-phosphate etherase [Bacilli bacterium]
MEIDIKKIGTERRNINTINIDQVSTVEALRMINNEDKTVAYAVEMAILQIELLVDALVEKFEIGGRLIYIGAGTSGRIGVLDSVECPPTFGVSTDMVQCVMAGGEKAFVKAIEGIEDSFTEAVLDLKNINLNSNDVVVGIAASGRTPYVIGGLEYAKSIGSITGCITTSPNSVIANLVDYPIEAITGSEPLTGSTRMKSGTAQKLICNMITTVSMIKLGKVYENLMIDVQMNNLKLVKRAESIVCEITGVDKKEASKLISKYKSVKKAIFSNLSGIKDINQINNLLDKAKGNIRKALEMNNND